MKLHSEHPYWMIGEGIEHRYPTLRENLRADVAIVGAGITGALVGHALCNAGLDVVIVDRRHVAHGSTAASTALLQYESDVPLFRLEQFFGRRMARRAWHLCDEALQQLGRLCAKIAGDVEFEARPSLWYATYRKHVKELLQPEYAARLAAGFDVSLLGEQDIAERFGFRAPGGILSRHAAQMNPYRLTNHLLERVAAYGGRVFESSSVEALEASPRQVLLRMQDDCTIAAKYAVVAAGYEAQRFLPAPVGRVLSTYAIISKPLRGNEPWYRNALLWETRFPYHYFRTTGDGRIIVGGRDDPFSTPAKRDAALPRKSRQLLADFQKQFPHLTFETDFWWAGTFTSTRDGLPYIGPCAHQRVLFALGYGGNGITFSAIAAELLRDRILGKNNPDADIFSFNRKATEPGTPGALQPARFMRQAAGTR